MRSARSLVAIGLAIAGTGAFAETGVNVGDIGYVAGVYGRMGAANVGVAGPLLARPADVATAGREPAQGLAEVLVKSKDADVNEVLGRA